jgi:DnaJ-domain-containing protein 1
MSDSAHPSAAPLDLDALERDATALQRAMVALRDTPSSDPDHEDRVDALDQANDAYWQAVKDPDVILALVAAARGTQPDRSRMSRHNERDPGYLTALNCRGIAPHKPEPTPEAP